MVKKISDEILLNSKAYSNLFTLCKTVGQRLSGSAGMYKGEAWGLKTLKDAGAEKVYLQECMIPHWVRGKKEIGCFKSKNKNATVYFSVLAIGPKLFRHEVYVFYIFLLFLVQFPEIA